MRIRAADFPGLGIVRWEPGATYRAGARLQNEAIVDWRQRHASHMVRRAEIEELFRVLITLACRECQEFYVMDQHLAERPGAAMSPVPPDDRVLPQNARRGHHR